MRFRNVKNKKTREKWHMMTPWAYKVSVNAFASFAPQMEKRASCANLLVLIIWSLYYFYASFRRCTLNLGVLMLFFTVILLLWFFNAKFYEAKSKVGAWSYDFSMSVCRCICTWMCICIFFLILPHHGWVCADQEELASCECQSSSTLACKTPREICCGRSEKIYHQLSIILFPLIINNGSTCSGF